MTDKERIEKIKSNRSKLNLVTGTDINVDVMNPSDVDYLIERAEENAKWISKWLNCRYYLQKIKDYMIDDINLERETSPHFIKNIIDEELEESE